MEDFFIPLFLFVVLPSIVFSFAYRIRKLKSEERIAEAQGRFLSASSGEELRLSELQALIDDAVDEATAPLRARLAALEDLAALEADRMGGRDALPGGYVDDAASAPPKTLGRARA